MIGNPIRLLTRAAGGSKDVRNKAFQRVGWDGVGGKFGHLSVSGLLFFIISRLQIWGASTSQGGTAGLLDSTMSCAVHSARGGKFGLSDHQPRHCERSVAIHRDATSAAMDPTLRSG
jgi:hypothetical protein